MNNNEETIIQGLREIFKVLKQQSELLAEIASYLSTNQVMPSFKRPIEEYTNFDWSQIGAQVITRDDYGVAQVSFRGKIYTRRNPENKYKEAIFYSTCIGKDEKGENKYERLITFTKIESAEPLSRKTEKILKEVINTEHT